LVLKLQHQDHRLHELGDFLRTRRARLTPEEVGLPKGTRRKTPGLRRAEVAQLVGVSVDWYTWLEQGRSITPSTQVLERLVQTLRLDAHERTHLFLLAQQQPPPALLLEPEIVSPALQRFLISKSPCIPRSRKQTRLAKWSSFWSSGINKRGRGLILLKRSTIFHRSSDQDKTWLDCG